jgi:hypothetical protein
LNKTVDKKKEHYRLVDRRKSKAHRILSRQTTQALPKIRLLRHSAIVLPYLGLVVEYETLGAWSFCFGKTKTP